MYADLTSFVKLKGKPFHIRVRRSLAPSWSDFHEGVSNFEHSIYYQKEKLTGRIQELKNDHPILDEITRRSIQFLPLPFNTVAQALYDSFDGSTEEKSNEIKRH